ncbi:MAG: glycosyltransferase [Bacteroidota bacterium]
MNEVEPIKISVIVPVYKVENYLKRCVDSVLCQSYKNLQIILVNDGSPDNCGKICDEFKKKDSRIEVIHQKNKGLSGARNSGLEKVKGEYVAFVDSDDWIAPNMLEVLIEKILKHKAQIIECDFKSTNEEKNNRRINCDKAEIVESRIEALSRTIENHSFSVWKRLYHKDLISGLRFIEGKNSEDVYFTFSAFSKMEKLVVVPCKLYYYYVGSESITRGKYTLKTLDSFDAAAYLFENINLEYNNDLVQQTANFFSKIIMYNYKCLHLNKKNIEKSDFYLINLRKNLISIYPIINKRPQVIAARYLSIGVFGHLLHLYHTLKRLNVYQ